MTDAESRKPAHVGRGGDTANTRLQEKPFFSPRQLSEYLDIPYATLAAWRCRQSHSRSASLTISAGACTQTRRSRPVTRAELLVMVFVEIGGALRLGSAPDPAQ
jgi:hypothetical protein